MKKIIVITETVEHCNDVIVHQAHDSWEDAVSSVRLTHCNCPDLNVELSQRKLFGTDVRQHVKVTYKHEGKKHTTWYLLTELTVHTGPNHL